MILLYSGDKSKQLSEGLRQINSLYMYTYLANTLVLNSQVNSSIYLTLMVGLDNYNNLGLANE